MKLSLKFHGYCEIGEADVRPPESDFTMRSTIRIDSQCGTFAVPLRMKHGCIPDRLPPVMLTGETQGRQLQDCLKTSFPDGQQKFSVRANLSRSIEHFRKGISFRIRLQSSNHIETLNSPSKSIILFLRNVCISCHNVSSRHKIQRCEYMCSYKATI